jgi:hypothetical protein
LGKLTELQLFHLAATVSVKAIGRKTLSSVVFVTGVMKWQAQARPRLELKTQPYVFLREL